MRWAPTTWPPHHTHTPPHRPRALAHVAQELENLKEDEAVFKMHGKVLILQDVGEARTTVNSRIKLIQTEM